MTLGHMGVRVGLLTSALIGAVAASAAAQETFTNIAAQNRGFYMGLGGGGNFAESSRFRGGGADATASYETGFVGLGSIGYALGTGLRLEVEPGYRRNDLDKIGGVSAHGHATIMTLMANAIWDVPFRVPGNLPVLSKMLPHIGVGAGVARTINSSAPYNGLSVTGNQTEPAFQAIAGLEYALTPGLKAGIDYRYLLVHDVNFRVAETGARTKAGDLNNHSVLLTLRYEFGTPAARPQPAAAVTPPPPVTPPPAAPAAPPPPVARDFTVYFATNSATLTPSARDIVRQAANTAQQTQATRINVVGHTDTTGSARYNQNLSQRRAAAVRAELIADGVPPDQIITSGAGETGLAVPTADHVNEPRNRRVVISVGGPGS
jgi:OOP family OmpA-OmpF porin